MKRFVAFLSLVTVTLGAPVGGTESDEGTSGKKQFDLSNFNSVLTAMKAGVLEYNPQTDVGLLLDAYDEHRGKSGYKGESQEEFRARTAGGNSKLLNRLLQNTYGKSTSDSNSIETESGEGASGKKPLDPNNPFGESTTDLVADLASTSTSNNINLIKSGSFENEHSNGWLNEDLGDNWHMKNQNRQYGVVNMMKFAGMAAADGHHAAWLQVLRGGSNTMSQSVRLQRGMTYTLSWYVARRQWYKLPDEFIVSVCGTPYWTELPPENAQGFVQQSFRFEASDLHCDVEFKITSAKESGDTNIFLDAISLTETID